MFTKSPHMPKVLFILKKRENQYHIDEKADNKNKPFSSGLSNSVLFVNHMLGKNKFDSKVVEVVDNNSIDKEVTDFKPDYVIIEALWVVPEKFEILQKLHPHVCWIVRTHSEIPFIANEGIAMGWVFKYLDYKNVYVAPNTLQMSYNLRDMIADKTKREKILFLPNYYNNSDNYDRKGESDYFDVGCFGAIRPLKNQLIQAFAAIKYAKKYNKKLRFHINSSRVERGNNVLKNIRQLFESLPKDEFQLVEHDWLDHEDFLKLVSKMDLGMQVSFSETFNIVVADFVSQGIPVITSKEILWMFPYSYADPTNIVDIVKTMRFSLFNERFITILNSYKLNSYNKQSEKVWLETLN